MNDLRTAAQQALEAMLKSHTCPLLPDDCEEAITALRAALAQQAEQAWVCPDSPEHRYAKPGHCEDCGKTLVQEQGCDHCNHPLYAATKCRVCGRVTEQAEPVEPVAGVVLNEEGRAALVEYGREEWHCVVRNARRLYTAPPQRAPLTEEEILRVKGQFRGTMNAQFVEFARAIEKAHGIGGQP